MVTALFFMFAQPLWAVEEKPASQVNNEESFFETIKRKAQEWFGEDDAPKAEVEKQAEKKPQPQVAQESDGRKAINTVKKEMKRISNNVSETVERDKKTIKKKLDKLSDNLNNQK
jgi:hypothetical protein